MPAAECRLQLPNGLILVAVLYVIIHVVDRPLSERLAEIVMKFLTRERTWRHSVPLRRSDASLARCDDARLAGLSIWRFKVCSEAILAIASTCRA